MENCPCTAAVPRSVKTAQLLFTIFVGGMILPFMVFVWYAPQLKSEAMESGIQEYFVRGDYLFSSWGAILPWSSQLIALAYAFLLPAFFLYALALLRGDKFGPWGEGFCWVLAVFAFFSWQQRGTYEWLQVYPLSLPDTLRNVIVCALAVTAVLYLLHRWFGYARKKGMTLAEQLLLLVACGIGFGVPVLVVLWILRGELLLAMAKLSRQPERARRLRERVWRLMPGDRVMDVLIGMEEKLSCQTVAGKP